MLVFPEYEIPEETLHFDPHSRLPWGQGSVHQGWQARQDFYDIGAQSLISHANRLKLPELLCFSEYSKPGDPVLKARPHKVLGDSVFFLADIRRRSTKQIATLLRQARSLQTFGVVSKGNVEPCHPKSGDLFFTDAFDGEMIILCEVQTR